MACDSVRGRAVLVDGADGGALIDSSIWEWDGSRWHAVSPIDTENDGNPTSLWTAVAYDP